MAARPIHGGEQGERPDDLALMGDLVLDGLRFHAALSHVPPPSSILLSAL